MRRIVLMLAVAALVAAGSAVARGDTETVRGRGVYLVAHNVFGLQTLVLDTLNFTATSGANGSASGSFSYRDIEDGAPFEAAGSVTCMTVIDNDAWIGGVIESSNDPTVIGLGGWWHVQSSGRGRGNPPAITTFLGIGSLAANAAFCANHPAFAHPFAVQRGFIEIGA